MSGDKTIVVSIDYLSPKLASRVVPSCDRVVSQVGLYDSMYSVLHTYFYSKPGYNEICLLRGFDSLTQVFGIYSNPLFHLKKATNIALYPTFNLNPL